ncbi:Hypp5113 [Branchiostoma lanceolatum]|uniref:Hypp5113 protein n=1 Tax=Branchiostoma lanceolatum TaxID=7740 RepID=A0A8K0AEC6_BRALA|nr:Hypp5113 [Branchiostoma lanceolatum]
MPEKMQPSPPGVSSHQEDMPFALRNPVPKHFAGWVSFCGILFLAGGIFVLKNDYLSSDGGKVMIALGLLAILGETGVNCCLSMIKWKRGGGDTEHKIGESQLVTAVSSASLAPAPSPAEMRGPSPTLSSRNLVALLPPSPLIVRLEQPQSDDRTEVKCPRGANLLSLTPCSSTSNVRASEDEIPPSYDDVVKSATKRSQL